MSFIEHHLGEFAALLTAFLRAVTSLSFESASHKIGSVPVFIILPAVILFKQKVTFPELLGAVVSVAGVALFFL
jgi:drug/metabolite transporter (DMT)-like permease